MLDGTENVIIGNGSSVVYDNIFRMFLEPGDEVIQHTPCFGIYKLRGTILGGKMVSVPMVYKDKYLHFDTDAILIAITDKTKIIVVANLNNPSGNFMETKDILRIAETRIPFVIDDAYVAYAGLSKSYTYLTKKYKNVIITCTLSKAYGLAGMRFGYALADKEVIAQISGALLPWNVGTIPLWAALAAFEDTEALAERVKFNNDAVDFIATELRKVPGLVVIFCSIVAQLVKKASKSLHMQNPRVLYYDPILKNMVLMLGSVLPLVPKKKIKWSLMLSQNS